MISCETNNIILGLSDPNFTIPKIAAVIRDSLAYTIECYGYRLREDHEIYKRYKRNLIKNCKEINTKKISGKLGHVIMKTETFSTNETDKLSRDKFPSVAFMRLVNCQLLANNGRCYACKI